MKGIILAGGSGTRLYPVTLAISKQLLPVYDKPMIYYPLSALMLAGIRDILIISTPHDLPLCSGPAGRRQRLRHLAVLCRAGRARGPCPSLHHRPRIRRRRLGGPGPRRQHLLRRRPHLALRAAANEPFGRNGLRLSCRRPQRYGVVVFDPQTKRPAEIVEKPKEPKSNWAVTGLYFYDNEVLDIAAAVKPSDRGELEITDVNREYLRRGTLRVTPSGAASPGSIPAPHDSLHDASPS
jgi:glucose-1-phosphate thymidylyltransferase